MTILGFACSMRFASSAAAKPPKTTEWIAPMRGARKHRHDRFRNHRHVDDHAVAVLDSLLEQRTRKSRNLVAQLAISEGLCRASDGGVESSVPRGRHAHARRVDQGRCSRCSGGRR